MTLTKARSAELVDIVFEVIKQTLESGEGVLISTFWQILFRSH